MLLFALLTPLALAGDDAHVQLQAGPVLQADQFNLGASARFVRKKDSYIGLEGRASPEGQWTGRAGAGVDLLGNSALDLKVGLFVGGTGSGQTGHAETVYGTELAAGMSLGRLYGQYRLLAGLGEGQLAELHTENELTLGIRVKDEVRLYGQFLTLNPGLDHTETAMALGLQFRI